LLILFASLNLHSRAGRFNYHSEIFSDKAGYYIYLPAVIIYKLDIKSMPDSIEFKTGEGFVLDRYKANKFYTKYPTGVAVLQLPFFLSAHTFCKLTDSDIADGFTRPYHNSINFAAVFYLIFGLIFLFAFLSNYVATKSIVLTLFCFLVGTNLYYYAVQETGQSHIYSFFAMSAWLFYYKKSIKDNFSNYKNLLLLGAFTGIILLIRPINIMFFPFAIFLDVNSVQNIKNRLALIGFKKLLLVGLISILVFSPQLLYYKYAFGSAVSNSYQNESFTNLLSPQLLRVWFAFENGLFTINPIHIFTIAAFVFMLLKRNGIGLISFLMFFCVSYVYASWWSPQLGCGLGHRGFVEYYSLFSLPFAFFINHILKKKHSISFLVFLFLLLCIIVNIKLTYTYDGCWYGNSPWDFREYLRLLFTETK